MENINFTPKQILQKEFKQKMRGYDPAEVDTFLDSIIKDYETFQREIDQLDQENQDLKLKVDELTRQVSIGSSAQSTQRPVERPSSQKQRAPEETNNEPVKQEEAPKAQPSSQPTQSQNPTDMDILKRLSSLERRVYGEDSDNSNRF
ncbi:cell division regulator GpsB [Fructilactobacillus fructivorans]|uniref:Cell cycle protein GpsB n=1 Tax=Fructilactobacillus fructivorans TaxID=1614 RepID=A0A0C1LY20_9LACO|nr:cell division regulator GpsB [Fructilactobacillus fructivorans]KID41770.1 Cell division protein GpsB, coordinates the switch between cylindrical and septal cell wall synthesis by re-localization of PBP1 [Fructilactobacillus fructivorans]MCT0151903.1 cell division regulator GpsB [Fructilactobacillus fructivorans]MCT2868140.1 cell division regulator GpsB [Fructilactobacillus fructivorans]MCT2869412.1 cell division regulator GpsB [Fructilactobacillus fructivorans]MCT2874112.1 cell division reg